MSNGWLCLHRSLSDHWLWQDKPFSRGQAWIDILFLANHSDNKFLFGNELITVDRGEFITSELKLMERWGWGKTKVRAFLSVLEIDNMIVKKSDHKKTAIKVVNYGKYNDFKTTDEPQTNHCQTTDIPLPNTNNNDNNVNNENKDNKYMDFITDVLTYLNQKTGKNYTGRSKAQKQHMVARIKEGFTVDDFKKVIDNKVRDWGNNPKMKIYLRPETLFGTKFETYLNDNEDAGQKKIREQEEINARQRANYDDETAHFFG